MNNTPKNYQPNYSNSWGLIIGINKYHRASPLGYAKNDATAIADTLKTKFGFPESNIILLTDENATKNRILESFLEYSKEGKIKNDDRILVFFAGHGHTVPGKRGEVGYLVPVDGKADDKNTLIRWDDFTRNADLIPAKHIFFIMDACYGGLAFVRTPSFGSTRFLKDMMKRYTRQVLTAGKADEVVADGNGVRPGHSMFTAHLINALEGAASTEDGIITANGVMAYVYDRVGRDQYSIQTPHYGFVEGDGDFIFKAPILQEVEGDGGEKPNGKEGENDILINTSPQIVQPANNTQKTIANSMKGLLSDPTKRIELDDFITSHVREFLDKIDLRHFPVQNFSAQKENFVDRLEKYKDISTNLQEIVILLSKWGNKEQLQLLETIFKHLGGADKGSSGTILWLRLNWYPLQILMYCAGISSLSSKNYDVLKIIFETPVRYEIGAERELPVATAVGMNLSEIHDSFKWIPGHERNYVPRSEYLFKELQPILEDHLFLGRSYEDLFDQFEILFALTYAYLNEKEWGPPGRFSWKNKSPIQTSPYEGMVELAKIKKNQWGPLNAGLFGSSLDNFLKVAEAYKARLDRSSW